MAYHPGRNFVLKYGASSPYSYVTVGGMRNTSIDIEPGPVDVTNKDSNGQQAMASGFGVWKGTISGQGIFDNGSVPLKALILAASPGGLTNVQLQIQADNGDTYTGQFAIRTLRRTGNYNEAETYDLTIESSGITFSAGS